ncbi:unnamed protein product [Bathycoccus prasinos]|jgi:phosphatidylinositol glycan class W
MTRGGGKGKGGFFRYDGRLKSETNRAFGGDDGNVFEIFFLTLFVLESVGVRCRREKDDDKEDDDDKLSLQNRWRDFLHVLFPTILCVFHPKLSGVLGAILCVRRIGFSSSIKKENTNTTKNSTTAWLNLYRSAMLLSACSAILAIDFSQMPRRLGKTKDYGVSLMDVGAGSFVASASCVKWRRTERSVRRGNSRSSINSSSSIGSRGEEGASSGEVFLRMMKRASISFILGFARYVSVKRSGYQLVEEEYGPMWNFFFSLAVIDILSTAIVYACGRFITGKYRMRNTFIVASSIAILVELLLGRNVVYDAKNTTMKLESWLLLPTKERGAFPTKYTDVVPFVTLNREGAFSCVGMTSLHFFGRFFGEYVHTKKSEGDLRRAVWLALMLWMVSYTSIDVLKIIKPSRRLCNFGYILWMSTYNVSAMVIMAFIHEQYHTVPSILQRANASPMLVFLFANVTTGLFNFILKDEIMRVHAFLAYVLMGWHMELIHMCINVLARMKSKQKQQKKKTN